MKRLIKWLKRKVKKPIKIQYVPVAQPKKIDFMELVREDEELERILGF